MKNAACFAACMLLLILAAAAGFGEQGPAQEKQDRILKLFADEFVSLTPGKGKFPTSFKMGSDKSASEQPVHEVTMGYPFALARYEVTQELYEIIMGKNPARWKGPRNSVEMLSWDEAVDFCNKATIELRKKKLLTDDEEVRLPSEAEWEYAYRAGTTTAWSFGDDVKVLGDYSWFDKNAPGNDPPVGKKKPNPWGLYDMHGYVWEWCADAWHADYKGAPADGSSRVTAGEKERVLRGGAFNTGTDTHRSAHRHHRAIETRTDAIGFRCVRAKKKGA